MRLQLRDENGYAFLSLEWLPEPGTADYIDRLLDENGRAHTAFIAHGLKESRNHISVTLEKTVE